MSAPASVLGVLAVCRVDFATLHSCKPSGPGASVGLCKVCKVYARARVRAGKILTIHQDHSGQFSPYARTKNPYTPYTPYTDALEALILLGSLCVGFVSGCGFLCWVGFGNGVKGHD